MFVVEERLEALKVAEGIRERTLEAGARQIRYLCRTDRRKIGVVARNSDMVTLLEKAAGVEGRSFFGGSTALHGRSSTYVYDGRRQRDNKADLMREERVGKSKLFWRRDWVCTKEGCGG